MIDELVFKGGTALFLCYGLDRFSEDLDFTQQKHYNYRRLQKTVSYLFSILGILHEIKVESTLTGKIVKIKAQGPLYRKPGSETFIALEISERNDILLQPDLKEIVPVYDDLRPFTIPVMKKEEILAEKIRALIIRSRARDLYDIYFLLKKGVKFDEDIINRNLSYYKREFDTKEFFKYVKELKNIWQSELQGLISVLPSFDEVINYVFSCL